MKKLFLPIMLVLILALAACGDTGDLVESAQNVAGDVVESVNDELSGTDEESTPEPTEEPTEEVVEEVVEEPAAGPSDRWAGSTLSIDMAAVGNATVSINGVEGQSDGNGNFELYVPRAEDGRYVINAELDGYVPVSQIHIGSAMEALTLEFQPTHTETFDPTVGVEAEDPSGTQISVGPNQLVDADGNEPTGDVTLNMYTYDLENEEMVGDMSGVNDQGEEVAMESAGAFYASFEDEDGDELNVKEGETVDVSVPVEEERPDEVLTVWSYDEETGLWVEEGVATLEDGRYVAEVSHFSYWNFDWEKRDPACIKLDIDADYLAANNPLSVRAVLQTNPTRVRDLLVTQETNVLINLPANTDVQFFAAGEATPFATTSSGEPWGGVGIPVFPYNVCNGSTTVLEGTPLILQSVNYPDRYLAVSEDGTQIQLLPVAPDSDDALKQRATFTQVSGLADPGKVSLQTSSGAYIVGTPDGVTLQTTLDTEELRQAATFTKVDGLAGTGVSFESLAYPGYHLRHSSFVLRLNVSNNTDLYNLDTSYNGVTEFAAVEASPVTGSLEGQVTDATDGNPIAGAEVCMQVVNLCATTDSDGRFVISGAPLGEQVIDTTAEGYIEVPNQTATVTADGDTERPIAMSPVVPVGQLRIVLEWGENPADLDSYLWLPDSTQILHNNKTDVNGTAVLNLDDTDGFGPETITILQENAGTYTYAVYNFSRGHRGASTTISESGAIVRVYRGEKEIKVYPAPTSGDGNWWHVFDIDGATSTITQVNTLVESEPR